MPEFFTESFDQFSSRLTPMDLVLWGVAAAILYVVFVKDNATVSKIVQNAVDSAKKVVNKPSKIDSAPLVASTTFVPKDTAVNKDELFFSLVASWQQTRKLAQQAGCGEAVKAIDQMFPYLSPAGCADKGKDVV